MADAIKEVPVPARLPIDVVPGSRPLRFKWRSIVDTPNGRIAQECEGPLPPSVEQSVELLIGVARQLLLDNALLRGQVDGHQRRAEQQIQESQQRVAAAAPLRTTAANKK